MESIRHGVSVPRNKLLFNHGINLLPYTGAGSGITRALQFTPDIKFVNDEMLKEFVVTVKRKNVEDDVEVGDRDERDKKLADNKLEESTSTLTDGDDRDKNVEDNVKVSHQQSRIPYKLLSGIQKDIIQFCSIARTYKEIHYCPLKSVDILSKPHIPNSLTTV